MQSTTRRAAATRAAATSVGGGGDNNTTTTTISAAGHEAPSQKKPRAQKPATPFANDPTRSARLPFRSDFAAPLSKPAFLETSLLDFLLQHSSGP